MARTGNRVGHGWQIFSCQKCGVETTRRKSLSTGRLAGAESKQITPRVCRDTKACQHRVIANQNKNMLKGKEGKEDAE